MIHILCGRCGMIGDKIYKFRKSKNLSQEEFANSIGVTRQIVSKWEMNQSIPGVDKLKKISDVYKIPYEELLSGTKYDNKKNNNIKKNILMFIVMIICQIIFVLAFSLISSNGVSSNYKCIGSQTYRVLEIYDDIDNNYVHVTLKKDDNIKTVMVSKVIASLIEKDKMYEFVFRSNSDNDDMEYIFNNNEIINIKESYEIVNMFNCK